MFTGLVEALGRVHAIAPDGPGRLLRIAEPRLAPELILGESVAVNGVCLTAVDVSRDSFAADVSPETLERTTLGSLISGLPVNLERAILPTTRLGGNIGQGHVDGRGTFISAEQQGDFRTVRIGFPPELGRYFVYKGSVAVEGISLTIAELAADHFDIAVIPKTWEMTNLSSLAPGDAVNLETDIIAKYVERMMQFR